MELWIGPPGHLLIVADEADGRRLGEPRGTIYTAAELRGSSKSDPAVVLEIHEWKRRFDGRIQDVASTPRTECRQGPAT